MRVIVDYPPNYDIICETFPIRSKRGILFSWQDNTLFNPDNWPIAPQLMIHESVHSERHKGDSLWWWDSYLKDPEFRLEEELAAHKAEYKEFCRLNKDRNARNGYLLSISHRLAGDLYGNIIRCSEAVRRISK